MLPIQPYPVQSRLSPHTWMKIFLVMFFFSGLVWCVHDFILPRTQGTNCLNKVIVIGRAVGDFLWTSPTHNNGNNSPDVYCTRWRDGGHSAFSFSLVCFLICLVVWCGAVWCGVGNSLCPVHANFKVVLFASSGIKRYFLCFLSPCVHKKWVHGHKNVGVCKQQQQKQKKNFSSSIVVIMRKGWVSNTSIGMARRRLPCSPTILLLMLQAKTQLCGKKEVKQACYLLANSDFWPGCFCCNMEVQRLQATRTYLA